MAITSFLPSPPTTTHHRHHSRHHHHSKDQKKRKTKKIAKPSPQPPPRPKPPPSNSSSSSSSSSSWKQLKSLLSCRSTAAATSQVHDPNSAAAKLREAAVCGSSICALRDLVHGNTRVVHRSDTDLSSDNKSSASQSRQHETAPLASRSRSARHSYQPTFISGCGGGSSYSSRAGMPLRRLSGCYECHAVSGDPGSRRYLRSRSSMCACSQCGEVFSKPESLEVHEAVRHSVSELGPEDSGRNIVEIIFKSSWQKKDRPILQIDRILKVHNTSRTVARFEDYRNAVKSRQVHHHLLLPHPSATAAGALSHLPQKKNPRCAADGNELLRFHCTTLSCPLGADGSTSLCSAAEDNGGPACDVCAVIRHGFARESRVPDYSVRTTASSGRAHDCRDGGIGGGGGGGGETRAMLVCRVIAGRVRRQGAESPAGEEEGYDSVAGEGGGGYGNIEELFVDNPRAILPCFVVIYRALD